MKQGQIGIMIQGYLLLFSALFLSLSTEAAHADTCFPPSRPYLPENIAAIREYAELVRQDFEAYISDVTGYFRCLDDERARAFQEAQDVTKDYQILMEALDSQ